MSSFVLTFKQTQYGQKQNRAAGLHLLRWLSLTSMLCRCVFDTQKHTFPASQYSLLSHLGEFAVNELEGPTLLAGAQPVTLQVDAHGNKALVRPGPDSAPGLSAASDDGEAVERSCSLARKSTNPQIGSPTWEMQSAQADADGDSWQLPAVACMASSSEDEEALHRGQGSLGNHSNQSLPSLPARLSIAGGRSACSSAPSAVDGRGLRAWLLRGRNNDSSSAAVQTADSSSRSAAPPDHATHQRIEPSHSLGTASVSIATTAASMPQGISSESGTSLSLSESSASPGGTRKAALECHPLGNGQARHALRSPWDAEASASTTPGRVEPSTHTDMCAQCPYSVCKLL